MAVLEQDRAWGMQQAVLRLLMQFQQYSDTQIANMVGCTPGMVAQIRRSPMARQQMELVKASAEKKAMDIQEKLNGLSQIAVEVLGQVLQGPAVGPGDKIKAALGVLDRTGYSPKRDVTVKFDYLSKNLEVIRARAEAQGVDTDPPAVEVLVEDITPIEEIEDEE